MSGPSVSVCFPAYNEEATLAEVVVEADTLLTRAGLDYEILVCDDGSRDRTGAIVDDLARRIPRLRALRHATNQGIRATFEDLYAAATKDFVFLNSTDRQWDTAILIDMLPLTRDWDIIVASRRRKPYGLSRHVVSWMYNRIPRVLFGVRTYDAGAVKLVRRAIIEKYPLLSRSPFSEAERLIRASRAGYRITEFPVDVVHRTTGRARGASVGAVLRALADVGRVWWALRRER